MADLLLLASVTGLALAIPMRWRARWPPSAAAGAATTPTRTAGPVTAPAAGSEWAAACGPTCVPSTTTARPDATDLTSRQSRPRRA